MLGAKVHPSGSLGQLYNRSSKWDPRSPQQYSKSNRSNMSLKMSSQKSSQNPHVGPNIDTPQTNTVHVHFEDAPTAPTSKGSEDLRSNSDSSAPPQHQRYDFFVLHWGKEHLGSEGGRGSNKKSQSAESRRASTPPWKGEGKAAAQVPLVTAMR